MSIRGQATLVISDIVLEETRRNLADKAPEALSVFDQLVAAVPFTVVKANKQEVVRAARQHFHRRRKRVG